MNPKGKPLADSRRSAGSVLLYVMFIALFVFPVLLVLTKRAITQNRLNVKDWQQKSARGLALNVPFDYVRQFSQRPFIDYGDIAQFNRPELFYSVGFTTVTFHLNAADHSVYLRALGKYGSNPNAPKSVKTLDSVIKFSSDLLLYTKAYPRASFTFSPGTTGIMQGGWFSRGLHILAGATPFFNGGPVVIDGEVDFPGSPTFSADVYYSDPTPNWGGANFINGAVKYPFVFGITMPPSSPNYYLTYNTLNTGNSVTPSSQTWKFGYDISALPANRSYFTIEEEAGHPRHVYPEAGAILLAENTALFLEGPVHGRVTVVCTGNGTPVGPAYNIMTGSKNVRVTGNVVIGTHSLTYDHGSGLTADSTHAFMLMVSSQVVFAHADNFDAPINFSGVIYSWTTGPYGKFWDAKNVGGPHSLTISGVDTAGLYYWWYPNSDMINVFDPGLARYPPPGLPETPRVVSLKPSY